MIDHHKRSNLFEQIERRFQFVIILALFLPSIWTNVSQELVEFTPGISSELFLYVIISSIFLTYIFVQMIQESMSKKLLEIIQATLLFYSFLLVTMIVAVTTAQGHLLLDWNKLAFGLSAALVPLLTIFILCASLLSGTKSVIRFFTKKRE